MPKPICFMVMPYGVRDTKGPPTVPDRVDFDALWEAAFRPAIEDAGYVAVRADQDLGSLILVDMIQRLVLSDLVLADLTLPNGNVYYEVGLRHAAARPGCVLVCADWTKPLFDVAQVRQNRYPLSSQVPDADEVRRIRAEVLAAIRSHAATPSPVSQALPGYPDAVDPKHLHVIRGFLDDMAAFQARLRMVRAAPRADLKAAALAERDRHPAAGVTIAAVAIEMVYLLRDCVGWSETLEYIDALPEAIRSLQLLREQRCLAQAKAGDHFAAIGALESLVAEFGDSSERQGLIGGRYKKLYAADPAGPDASRFLSRAIEHYERGMRLDLNDYYPSCNLPSLYRARGRPQDAAAAVAAATVARIACERAIVRTPSDEWVRPTLLGLAFFEADADMAEALCERICDEGPAAWKVATTLEDLRRSATQVGVPAVRARLEAVVQRLEAIAG